MGPLLWLPWVDAHSAAWVDAQAHGAAFGAVGPVSESVVGAGSDGPGLGPVGGLVLAGVGPPLV